MLRCLSGIVGYRIHGLDGEFGKVHDFLFDDALRIIRYVVGESHSSRDRKRFLISSELAGQPDWGKQALPVALTVAQVKSSLEEDATHWAQFTRQAATGADWRFSYPFPHALAVPGSGAAAVCEPEATDFHLCGLEQVIGLRVRARDGRPGDIYDIIVDDDGWRIRYVAVSIGNWLLGRKVLLSPCCVEPVCLGPEEVAVSLSRAEIENSPAYDPLEPVNRDYQVRLYDYSGRPSDWE